MNTKFYHAKVLKSKENQTFVIENDQEVWILGNRIAYIGDGQHIQEVNGGLPVIWDKEIDVKGNLLMPGFKNAHTHTAMTFLRSFADDLPLQEWLTQQVFPKEGQLTEEMVVPLNQLGILEYLQGGITSNFDMYFYPKTVAEVNAKAGFRTVLVSGMNNYGGTPERIEDEYLSINGFSELTSYRLGFHAEYTTSMELMEGLSKLAHKYQEPVFTHNSETKREVEECRERYGKSPTQIMDEIGLFDYGGGGYHCIWLDDKDFEIFSKRKMTAVTNPASNLKLASGIAPISRFLSQGIDVAIGTDGPASNNCLDMFREMYLTTALAKVKEQDASAVPADKVLYMAVTQGARAMGLDDCDSLEVGKLADLIMINLQEPNMQPENNIIKNLVYSGNRQNVMMTMINGKILYENGIFNIGIDPKEIYQKANQIIRGMK